jgi:hypothetical protein
MDEKEPTENATPLKAGTTITLQKSIELGEYDPKYLATFAEWHDLSRHSQFELVKQALRNRQRQLEKQWAEISNMIDFSLKPNLQEALKNIEEQKRILQEDKERLYVEYSAS